MKKSQADFLKLVKSIEKSNAKFAKASPSQRIVMVSKDILSLLALNRVRAKKGIYVKVPELRNFTEVCGDQQNDTCQLQDILKMPMLPACSVCAIGGAMFATTLRLNQVEVRKSDVGSYPNASYFSYETGDFGVDAESQMSERTREVFPNQLLRLMESAFEHGSYGYNRLSANNRMKAIYQNLIDNKGKKFTSRSGKYVIYPIGA